MDSKAYVKTDIHQGIANIEFYHPAHNSLPGEMLKSLATAIQRAGENTNIHFIILSSGGDRTFCAGASFNELSAIKTEEQGKAFFLGFANVINAVRTCGKIVIGRVQGKAVGGGVGLVAACDYAMATKYASIKLSELAIGIGPFVIGPAVERKIGLSSFSYLSLNPTEWKTAQWAKGKGLYAECFQTTDQLDDYVKHFSEKLLTYSPAALAELKQVFWKGTSDWKNLLEKRAELSGKLVLSRHARDAINSFLTT